LQVADRQGVSMGTSMASPMAAGVIALLLQADRTLTQDVLRALLQAGAHPVRGAAPFRDQSGPGELDAKGALDALAERAHPELVLPDPSRSWITLSQDFAPADGSYPLRVLLDVAARHGVRAEDIPAIATAATRNAPNGRAFIDRLRADLGAARRAHEWGVVRRGLEEAQTGIRLTDIDVGDEQPVREHVFCEAAGGA
jgi:subtilisin family serine protease